MEQLNETPADRRSVMLRLRVTTAEKLELKNRASNAGLTISDWIRSKAIGTKPVIRKALPNKEVFLRLLGAIGKAGSNCNQIARQIHRRNENFEYELPLRDIANVMEEFKTVSQLLRKELDGNRQG